MAYTLEQLQAKLQQLEAAGRSDDADILRAEIDKAKQSQGGTAAEDFARFASAVTTKPEVTAKSIEQTQAKHDYAQYEALPGWKKPLVAGMDIANVIGSDLSMGWGEKAAAGLRSGGFSGPEYEEELAKQRQQVQGSRNRAGWAGTTGSVATAAATLPQLTYRGAAAVVPQIANMGKIARGVIGSVLGGAEGAGYGALNAMGHDEDVSEGAKWGALFGAGGSLAADAIMAGAKGAGRLWSEYGAEPADKALQALYRAAIDRGLDPAKLAAFSARHGDDAMALDVLGTHGTGLGRSAANTSPAAREVLESRLNARKSGQNERVAGKIEEAADLPKGAGNRRSVSEFREEAYARQRPAIDEAYEAARAAGYDLPREPFQAILETPLGKTAYDQAATSLLNRKGTEGIKATSELARLDQTVRELDDIATTAYRQGNRDRGSQAAALARKLKQQMDASIAGPEYQTARQLARERHTREEAINLGEEMAGSRIPTERVNRAEQITDPDLKKGMAQSYALKQSENLANKGSTEGAVNILERPAQKRASKAALGEEGAKKLEDQLETERMFNRHNRDVTGNSSTMRQLADIAGGTAGGGALSYITGWGDPLQLATAGGLARAAPRVVSALQRRLATRGQQQTMEEMAHALTRSPQDVPLEPAIPPSALEQFPDWLRNELARIAARSGQVGPREER